MKKSRDSSVGIDLLRAGRPRGWGSSPGGGKNFHFSKSFQAGSRVQPNLLSNGYWGLFPGGKAAEAWSWPLTSN
jgi:hypothetical protein